MAQGMIGRKLGMIRLFDGGGRVRGCTVIELGPNRVTQLRTSERDGYEAVQVGFPGNRKRLTRPARGHLRQAGVDAPLGVLKESRVEDASVYELGQELTVADFEPGQYVNVTASSKGRGFAGVVKRWNFRGAPKTHGGKKPRSSGSVGAGTSPGRTWRGQKMGGHMGSRRKTVLNLLVVQIDAIRNLIFVEGSAPGPTSGIVTIGPARKPALAGYEPPPPFAVDAEELDDADRQPAGADAEAATDNDENDGEASE